MTSSAPDTYTATSRTGISHLAASAHQHLMRLQQESNTTALAAAAAAAAPLPPLHPGNSGVGGGSGGIAGDTGPTNSTTGGTSSTGAGAAAHPVRLDTELALVRTVVERVVLELVTGVRSSAEIKRALLSHAVPLAAFFGRRDLNDLLLPLLITCLNAAEWQLR